MSKAYPKYKPSGVEWLGDVPEHWEISPLKFVCRLAYGDSLSAEDREDGNYAVYGSNGAVGTHNKANTLAPVIVVGRKGSYGKLNFSDKPVFSIDTTYFIDNRFTKQSLLWLKYALQPLNLDEGSKDSAVPGLAHEDAYINKIPLPPLPEQQAIAAFLDHETGRIDALIAKKERLLELLAEQRTALISHAVTKGLDATVKLKPSGVEWLGDVPEHWEVKRLKYQVSINDETLPETTDPDYEMLYIDISSVDPTKGIAQKDGLIFGNAPSRARRIVRDGDTIVSTVRTYLRAIAPVTAPEENLIVSTGFAVIRPQKINKNFLSATIRAPYFIEEVVSRSVGVDYPAINASEIGFISIPLPPLPEQQAIAAFLDRETAKIDALSAKVTTVIERLKEYRTALISSAVTGKIDVSTTLNTSVKATT